MRDISKDHGAYAVCNSADTCVIPVTAIGRCATDNELRLMFLCLALHHVVVHETGLFAHAIVYSFVELTGEVNRRSMRKVASHAQVKTQYSITRLQHCKHYR